MKEENLHLGSSIQGDLITEYLWFNSSLNLWGGEKKILQPHIQPQGQYFGLFLSQLC